MASIEGLGSGLDVSTIISQLMSIEKQPQQRLVTQRQTVLNRASAWTSVETQLTGLKAALDKVKAGGLSATTATSSAPSVAGISGLPTAAGVHELKVTKLATAQRVTSAGTTTSTIGAGRLTFHDAASTIGATSVSTTKATGTYRVEVVSVDATSAVVRVGNGSAQAIPLTGGTVDGITLTATALEVGTASVTVATTGSTGTLDDLARQVNAAAGAMSAVVVSDGAATPSYRLVLSGSQTGVAANVTVASTFTGVLADKELNRSPGTGSDPLVGNTKAVNAELTFNGIAVTRPSNSVTDLVPGATLSLAAPGTTTLTIAADSGASVAAGKAVVDALNGVLRQIAASTKYDQTARKAGPLTGDGGARGLARSLTEAVTQAARDNTTGVTLGGAPTSGTSSYTTPNLGIAMQKDGTYAFDSTAFAAALRDRPTETKAFVGAVAAALTTVATDATASTGVVSTSKQGVSDRAAQLQKQVDQWDDRLRLIEDRLRRQYSALDTALGSLRSQGSWLASQIAGLPSGSSS